MVNEGKVEGAEVTDGAEVSVEGPVIQAVRNSTEIKRVFFMVLLV